MINYDETMFLSVCYFVWKRGDNALYHDAIFDNNTLLVEVIAQMRETALPGSQHNILVTVDYGMDAVDYINNITVNATDAAPPIFNAVCLTLANWRIKCVQISRVIIVVVMGVDHGGTRPQNLE